MEKIEKIKSLQIYILSFIIIAGIGILRFIPGIDLIFLSVPFVAMIITIGTLITYILLWVSFAQTKKLELKSRSKYLILAILITIVTTIMMIVGVIIAMQFGMIISAGTTAEINSATETFGFQTKIINIITLVFTIIYIGLGTMIYNDNKNDAQLAKDEYTQAYQ